MTDDDLLILVASMFKLEQLQITDDLCMENTEAWDSLKHMELIAAIEERAGIELDFEQITQMTSVGGIRRVLSDINR